MIDDTRVVHFDPTHGAAQCFHAIGACVQPRAQIQDRVDSLGDSILNEAGTKLIFATPEDGKINVCDVWSKRKETKKRISLTTEPSTEEFARSSHDGYKSYIR